jgi:hypothetical protein
LATVGGGITTPKMNRNEQIQLLVAVVFHHQMKKGNDYTVSVEYYHPELKSAAGK